MIHRKPSFLIIILVCVAGFSLLLPHRECAAIDLDEYGRPMQYSVEFDSLGYIDQLEGNSIVIDDRAYDLLSSTRYFSETNRGLTKQYFSPGKYVGFQVQNETEITGIWLTPAPK